MNKNEILVFFPEMYLEAHQRVFSFRGMLILKTNWFKRLLELHISALDTYQ